MKIEIKTGNAAFHDCDAGNEYADYYTTATELDRIFGQISRDVAEGGNRRLGDRQQRKHMRRVEDLK